MWRAAAGINGNIGGPSPVTTLSNGSPITLVSGVPIFGGISSSGPYGAFSVSQHFVTGYSNEYEFQCSIPGGQGCCGRGGLLGQLEPPLTGHAGCQSNPDRRSGTKLVAPPITASFPT